MIKILINVLKKQPNITTILELRYGSLDLSNEHMDGPESIGALRPLPKVHDILNKATEKSAIGTENKRDDTSHSWPPARA